MPKHLFTSATARVNSAKGHHARWHSKPAQITPQPGLAMPPAMPEYAARCLARTRSQLDLVADQITEELKRSKLDTRRVRDLTDAQSRLQEQERILDGRPLPGSRRPKSDAGKVAVAGAWLDDQPAIDPTSPPVPQVASSPSTAACVPEAHVTPQQVVVLPVDSITQKPQDTQPADVGPVAETGD